MLDVAFFMIPHLNAGMISSLTLQTISLLSRQESASSFRAETDVPRDFQ